MDHLTNAAAAVPADRTVIIGLEHAHYLSLQHIIPFLAVAVWLVEYKRRNQPDTETGKRFVRQLLPEMLCLTALCGLVVVLLVCHRDDSSIPKGDQAWTDVKSEWPLLMTADTLIGFQAMLRLVFLLSASLRRTGAHLSPLDGEPAAFFFLAALVRVVLLALSPSDVYRLDGPLGGDFNVAMEVTAFLLLLPLGVRMLQKGIYRIAGLLFVVMLLAPAAMHNHFALADSSHSHLDILFSLVMLLEMVAGVAFYVRSARVKGGYAFDAFSGFAHFVLPLQQALPTYFLLVAFAAPFQVEPTLVGKGRPFELLQAGGVMQVAMYVLAAVVYSVSCAEERQVSLFAEAVPASSAPAADECVICLGSCVHCEDAEAFNSKWRRLRCGHQFHEQCIFEWLKKAQQCPMCRRHICEKGTVKWLGNASSAGQASPALAASDELQLPEESVPLLDRSETALDQDVVPPMVL